jgi:hypothetical protein
MNYKLECKLKNMTTKQLLELNRMTAKILRSRREREIRKNLLEFEVGDHVGFTSSEGEEIKGYVAKINRKTVSVDAYDPHGHWRVSPRMLSKIARQNTPPPAFQKPLTLVGVTK